MTDIEIHDIARNGVYERTPLRGKVEETHISWVVLSEHFAFKIKKPLKLSFLDFSTLEARRIQCERELMLNRRFSDIYLAVEPIRRVNDQWILGGMEEGQIVDYCVVMRRMAAAKRLDNVLRSGKGDEDAIRRLAKQVAAFHENAETVHTPFDMDKAAGTFNDIASVVELVSDKIGEGVGEVINRSIAWSNSFLEAHHTRMQERIEQGFKKDVHGDLHSGNIFLYRNPVLFDCIEFNDEFRQVDVLDEVAFLCMDFERFHWKRLADLFLEEYEKHFPAFVGTEDRLIFTYFKCLRANVRAKVHAVRLGQAGDERQVAFQSAEVRGYLNLMETYMAGVQ